MAHPNPEVWLKSFDVLVLHHARMELAPDWSQGHGLTSLPERFTDTKHWDDPSLLTAAYDRHNDEVRRTVPPQRLLEWRGTEGWEPVCRALGLPVPDLAFPWIH